MDRKKVVLGMSGGVDSSVAAYLLLESGYEVVGMTMVLWDENDPSFPGHPSAVDRAKTVCEYLGIEHQIWNFHDVFAKTVVRYFEDEYRAGRTPNPCVYCNRIIKWGEVITRARQIPADYVATGQYARVRKNPHTGRFEIYRSADAQKDQTYVLWGISQESLAMALFPMGDWTKNQTRQKALEIGLPTAQQEESQEICFVPRDDYRRFLMNRHPDWKPRRGPIKTADQRVVGEHDGYWYYTIGQRRGIGVAMNFAIYVTGMDPASNTVFVGSDKDLLARRLVAHSVNFIPFERLSEPMRITARIRYNDPGSAATLLPLNDTTVEVIFDKPRRAITPGQSAVFYHHDQLVGGGIIDQAIP